jgi:hypothetical protein
MADSFSKRALIGFQSFFCDGVAAIPAPAAFTLLAIISRLTVGKAALGMPVVVSQR